MEFKGDKRMHTRAGELEIDYVEPTEENLKKIMGKKAYEDMQKAKEPNGQCFLCGRYDWVYPIPIIVCKEHIRALAERMKDYNLDPKACFAGVERSSQCHWGHETTDKHCLKFNIRICSKCVGKISRQEKEANKSGI